MWFFLLRISSMVKFLFRIHRTPNTLHYTLHIHYVEYSITLNTYTQSFPNVHSFTLLWACFFTYICLYSVLWSKDITLVQILLYKSACTLVHLMCWLRCSRWNSNILSWDYASIKGDRGRPMTVWKVVKFDALTKEKQVEDLCSILGRYCHRIYYEIQIL